MLLHTFESHQDPYWWSCVRYSNLHGAEGQDHTELSCYWTELLGSFSGPSRAWVRCVRFNGAVIFLTWVGCLRKPCLTWVPSLSDRNRGLWMKARVDKGSMVVAPPVWRDGTWYAKSLRGNTMSFKFSPLQFVPLCHVIISAEGESSEIVGWLVAGSFRFATKIAMT